MGIDRVDEIKEVMRETRGKGGGGTVDGGGGLVVGMRGERREVVMDKTMQGGRKSL